MFLIIALSAAPGFESRNSVVASLLLEVRREDRIVLAFTQRAGIHVHPQQRQELLAAELAAVISSTNSS